MVVLSFEGYLSDKQRLHKLWSMDDSLTSDEENARSHFVSHTSAGEAISTVITTVGRLLGVLQWQRR